MKSKSLNIVSIIAGISLVGILITQSIWLKKTNEAAERQFDHRASQMIEDVLEELQTYADTSTNIDIHSQLGDLRFYDVVDTLLLKSLLGKYAQYHSLDTVLNYALIISKNRKILHGSKDFKICQEKEAYKACLSCVWKKEYIHLSVFFPNRTQNIRSKLIIWAILSLIFSLATLGAVIFIIVTYFRQKKIAVIKNDFVNNMTHELKTPISTISVASEVLMQTNEESKDNKISKYSKIIFDENQRMRKLVEKVLNIATLDKGRPEIDKEKFDLHPIICKTVNNFCFETCDEQVQINFNLNAENSIIEADLLHIRNIINNLIDNAVKYSDDIPKIAIDTLNINGNLKIIVSDNGKGIPKDSLKKVFEKFYRVPAGNVHNVKGFGLGLFYVKTMIEAHNGKVEIKSTLNKGTAIEILLPQ